MSVTALEFQSAYAYLLAAMELVEHAMQEEAAQHRRDFIWQMQQLGLNEVSVPDRFLPYAHARTTLMLLQSFAAIEETLMRLKPADGQKAFLPNLPLLPQMQDKIADKIDQHRQHYRSTLDKERQTATGITRYTWVTQGNDKVRDSHARREGQVFDWNSLPFPGSEFGCRCSATPLLEDMALPDDPPIEPVYPVETLIGLLGGGSVYRIGAQIVGRFIARNKIPSANPVFKRPKDVPEEWTLIPSDKGDGVKFVDPKNIHNDIRIQKGNPKVSNPSQQLDYIKWKRHGQWMDKDGNFVSGKSPESHIPIKDFRFNPEMFK